jgi:hypothetical protein
MVAELSAVCFCLLVTAACAGQEEDMAPTPTGAVSESTPAQPASPGPEGTPATAGPTDISSRGEEIETLANSVARKITWEDGTAYEATISDLVFRTAGKPDAGQGRRVVASWLGDARWQVTIFTRVSDHSTEPETVTDLIGEFYYDEEKDEFTAANGRALFALTGQDPCASDQPEPDYCPLDKELRP